MKRFSWFTDGIKEAPTGKWVEYKEATEIIGDMNITILQKEAKIKQLEGRIRELEFFDRETIEAIAKRLG